MGVSIYKVQMAENPDRMSNENLALCLFDIYFDDGKKNAITPEAAALAVAGCCD